MFYMIGCRGINSIGNCCHRSALLLMREAQNEKKEKPSFSQVKLKANINQGIPRVLLFILVEKMGIDLFPNPSRPFTKSLYEEY